MNAKKPAKTIDSKVGDLGMTKEQVNEYFAIGDRSDHAYTLIRNLNKEVVVLVEDMSKTETGKMMGGRLIKYMLGMYSDYGVLRADDGDDLAKEEACFMIFGMTCEIEAVLAMTYDAGLLDEKRGMRVMDLNMSLKKEMEKVMDEMEGREELADGENLYG